MKDYFNGRGQTLMPERDLRKQLGVSEATFFRWRKLGLTPAAVTVLNRRYYTLEAFEEWCISKTVKPTKPSDDGQTPDNV